MRYAAPQCKRKKCRYPAITPDRQWLGLRALGVDKSSRYLSLRNRFGQAKCARLQAEPKQTIQALDPAVDERGPCALGAEPDWVRGH